MGLEVARKFLVKFYPVNLINVNDGSRIVQGYFSRDAFRTVRIRILDDPTNIFAFITIKSAPGDNATRIEYEYAIPVEDTGKLLDICLGFRVEKMRYPIMYKGLHWIIDHFTHENKGLILAEAKLSTTDQAFELPPWIGKEVTDDLRYSNSYLSMWSHMTWSNTERST